MHAVISSTQTSCWIHYKLFRSWIFGKFSLEKVRNRCLGLVNGQLSSKLDNIPTALCYGIDPISHISPHIECICFSFPATHFNSSCYSAHRIHFVIGYHLVQSAVKMLKWNIIRGSRLQSALTAQNTAVAVTWRGQCNQWLYWLV